MRKKVFLVSAFLISSLISLLSGCYKEPTFDVVPAIEFADIRKETVLDAIDGQKKDSVILTIKFQDGDGDIGFDSKKDADAINAAAIKGDFHFVVKTFQQRRGRVIPREDFNFSGFPPRLKNDGKIGPIEGKLDYSMDFPFSFTAKRDSLKFQVFIKDRAGNISNTVESKIIVLNE
jgi:hypothetical protein